MCGNNKTQASLVAAAAVTAAASKDESGSTGLPLQLFGVELFGVVEQQAPPNTWHQLHTCCSGSKPKECSFGLGGCLVLKTCYASCFLLHDCLQELECQLVAASEEKTQVQSKYHELSIKHRQLIETSPQIATIWNEVLIQQNAAANGDAATMQRLTNFDLRHTGASSGLSAQLAAAAAAGQPVNGVVSPKKLPGVASATAIFNHGGPPPGGSEQQ